MLQKAKIKRQKSLSIGETLPPCTAGYVYQTPRSTQHVVGRCTSSLLLLFLMYSNPNPHLDSHYFNRSNDLFHLYTCKYLIDILDCYTPASTIHPPRSPLSNFYHLSPIAKSSIQLVSFSGSSPSFCIHNYFFFTL